MRTTLDIDSRVLAAARARVNEGRNRSIGEAVSELAIAGMTTGGRHTADAQGLVLLPSAPGHVITDDMVAQALLDE
ncbi:hypothetical protein V1Y59_13490 [Gordonia sp. PKS22-38]|uniref:DUF2191 domain-containing protein n=1 Tax=Gordonia prachuapensis TaxID=3115651 RepID=A0ABU7MUU0_9ACTN|nr:hypothetical protein [Gordonia sp. PKS22-38]